MNSGIFVTERGASSIYTALFTKADVLDASEQEHYSHGTVKRMIGGSFLNILKMFHLKSLLQNRDVPFFNICFKASSL